MLVSISFTLSIFWEKSWPECGLKVVAKTVELNQNMLLKGVVKCRQFVVEIYFSFFKYLTVNCTSFVVKIYL